MAEALYGPMYDKLTPPQLASGGGDFSGLSGAGFFTSVAGTLLSSIGTYYSAQTQKSQYKSQALSAEFAQSMANINARGYEQEADAILEAGHQEAAQVSAAYGAEKSARKVGAAARGIRIGVGSAAEEQASVEYAKQLDMLTINANSVRAANAARTRGVDSRNQGLLAGVSAQNMRATARSINPYAGASASLLGSSGTLASQWVYNRRYQS